ncbi:MAG: sel1 repeat family protein [Candidatus Riflebacteria bacterium]|nr:sel1 repeat family protein [Candidatus Riflebacteria bacterium]
MKNNIFGNKCFAGVAALVFSFLTPALFAQHNPIATGPLAPAAYIFRHILASGILHQQQKCLFPEKLRLAEQGDAGSQYYIGIRYHTDMLFPRDRGMIKFLLESAAQKIVLPVNAIRWMLEDILAANDKESMKWLLKAADKGHVMAQRALSWMCNNGKGTPLDLVQAYMWLKIAEDNRSEVDMNDYSQFPNEMIIQIESMDSQLTLSQRQDALSLARKWKAAHPNISWYPDE